MSPACVSRCCMDLRTPSRRFDKSFTHCSSVARGWHGMRRGTCNQQAHPTSSDRSDAMRRFVLPASLMLAILMTVGSLAALKPPQSISAQDLLSALPSHENSLDRGPDERAA